MNFKLTPLFLFLILLFVLLLGSILSDWLFKINEGFISYNESQTPIQSQLTIPQYSTVNTVYKLYDSVYFDSNNGNLIQLFGKPYDGTNVDTSGGSLTSISLVPRSGGEPNIYNVTTANTGTSVDQSMVGKSVSNNNNKINNFWIYPTPSNYNTGLPYQVFYILWNNQTYLHLYDISNAKNISTFIFSTSGSPTYSSYTNSTVTIPTSVINDTNPANNSFNNQTLYDASKNGLVYNITNNVFFDTTNANLIIQNKANGVSVYNGSVDSTNNPTTLFTNIKTANQIHNTPSSISNSRTQSFVVSDLDDQKMVLYIPNQQTTMIVVFSQDAGNSKLLSIIDVVRFNPNISGGIDFPGATVSNPSTNTPNTQNPQSTIDDVTMNINENVSSDSVISNYYNKYWNKSGQCKDVSNSNDYLLKTQIIPPVCPACPTCPSNTTCSNCGGNGGSGTVGVSNVFDVSGNPINTLYDARGQPISTLYDSNGKPIHVVSNGGIVSGIANLGNSAAGGAERVVGDVLGGAGVAGSMAIGGAERIGGDVLGGAERVGGDIYGVGKNIGSGIGNVLGLNGQGKGQGQGQGQGQGTPNGQGTPGLPNGDVQKNDGYAGRDYGGYGYPPMNTPNYNTATNPQYGAVPPTKSNFMPITSSFSAFGK